MTASATLSETEKENQKRPPATCHMPQILHPLNFQDGVKCPPGLLTRLERMEQRWLCCNLPADMLTSREERGEEQTKQTEEAAVWQLTMRELEKHCVLATRKSRENSQVRRKIKAGTLWKGGWYIGNFIAALFFLVNKENFEWKLVFKVVCTVTASRVNHLDNPTITFSPLMMFLITSLNDWNFNYYTTAMAITNIHLQL